uniref:Uncharacterized protein n=1 Tax=Solibacter usitatus (strain Ellin6076) TaxID=234267 RepID=Q01P87_SOLUE
MSEAVGPMFAAGFQDITNSGYDILYLPDLHNDELQREGKAPVYWWLPNTVRLARQNGDAGDYKFSFIHFEGVRSASTSVGVSGQDNEVTGGLLSFSTTSAPPSAVLLESQNQLLNRFRGNDDKYWGWRTPVAPQFRPAPIVSNTMTITNLSPTTDGSTPAVGPAGRGKGLVGGPRDIMLAKSPPLYSPPRSVSLGAASRSSNLDMWYANLQGAGNGSVSPFAENAFSGLVGSIPAALIWTSFHTGIGGISVWQKLKIKVWSPVVHIHIEGEWDKIQEHFSAAAHASGLFWSADIQAQVNIMRMNGTLTVVSEVDTTLPNADKIQEQLDKRTDLIVQKFMDQAQKTIFDPAPFNEKPAEASGGFLGFGGGAAFKLRVDKTHLHLMYDERKEMAYLQDYPISGAMEGLYDVIKKDPTAEKKYFTTLYLDDWERKVSRIVKPVVNWPNAAQKWVGEPVAFLSAQIGYPNTQGVLQWDGHIFQPNDPPDAMWNTAMAMKAATDVANPPANWKPDQTFLKREIHFNEPPNETEYPFVRIAVEQNMVDLDPGDNGRPTSDINLEIRVDDAGALNVGPINLDVDLDNAKQIVEVTFQAQGQKADGTDRAPVKFSWNYTDQAEPRYWMIFTGQVDYIPKYKYQVRVIVKGGIFTKGMSWTGPWVDASANGPIMVTVPTEEDAGVTITRDYVPQAAVVTGPPPAVVGAAAGMGGGYAAPSGPPPASYPSPSKPPGVTSPSSGPPPTGPSGPPPAMKSGPPAGQRTLQGYSTVPATPVSRDMPQQTSSNGQVNGQPEPMFSSYKTSEFEG